MIGIVVLPALCQGWRYGQPECKNCLKVLTKYTLASRRIKRRLRPNGNKMEKLKTTSMRKPA